MKFEFPFSDPHHSGNLARQLLDALQEAQDFDQFEANWALKQHVEETKNLLRQMIRTASMRDDDLVILQLFFRAINFSNFLKKITLNYR